VNVSFVVKPFLIPFSSHLFFSKFTASLEVGFGFCRAALVDNPCPQSFNQRVTTTCPTAAPTPAVCALLSL
jgi:hypothetical protein